LKHSVSRGGERTWAQQCEKFGFRGLWVSAASELGAGKFDRWETQTGSQNATRAAAGIRAHLLLAQLRLSLLVGGGGCDLGGRK